MSKYGVIYYTRTNNSKRVAEKIANRLSSELIQIKDDIHWKGLIGYLKAGFYSMTKRHVDIQLSSDLDTIESYIVVGPLWAGGLAPSLLTLLDQLPRDKVHLVVTSIGSHVEDRSGYLSVHDITRNTGNEDSVVEALVTSLQNG
jgi:flavodoxin